jgi:hypothetical protein
MRDRTDLKWVNFHVVFERLGFCQQCHIYAGNGKRWTCLLTRVCRKDQAQHIVSNIMQADDLREAVLKGLSEVLTGSVLHRSAVRSVC